MKHVLFKLDELPPGHLRPAKVDDTPIVVVRSPEGALSAMRDRCPHAGARLSYGHILRKVIDVEDGGYALSQGEYVLRCPWHAYEFDLETGQCVVEGANRRVRVFDVGVEDDYVVVEV